MSLDGVSATAGSPTQDSHILLGRHSVLLTASGQRSSGAMHALGDVDLL